MTRRRRKNVRRGMIAQSKRDKIREAYWTVGATARSVAKRFRVSHATVLNIAWELRDKPPRERPKCSAPGCDQPHFSGGYCTMHRGRLLRHGSLESRKRRMTDEERAEILADYATGEWTIQGLADKRNRHRDTIRKVIREAA